MELRNQIAQSGVQVDVDAPKGQDLAQIMAEMRTKYEKMAQKNQDELKKWHESQVWKNIWTISYFHLSFLSTGKSVGFSNEMVWQHIRHQASSHLSASLFWTDHRNPGSDDTEHRGPAGCTHRSHRPPQTDPDTGDWARVTEELGKYPAIAT